tara:strand:- start:129 stop:326 length:198 start_codon:yes stop_codon:yes gene_type:complete
MRSYKVFGIKDGAAEVYITTVYSAAEGKVAHNAMRSQAYFDEMIVRDCLGGTVMRKELKEMVDTA